MIFKFTDGTEYTVLNDLDFKHMIGYYLENDLKFFEKENIDIITNNSIIDSLNMSNITKSHIQNLFDFCTERSVKIITTNNIKKYCVNNDLKYQSIYILFRRIFGTDFIEKLNDLYKKYTTN